MLQNQQTFIAALALLCSIFAAITHYRDRRLTKYNLEKTHLDSLLNWHHDVVRVLCDLRDDSIHLELRNQSRRTLSALIEQGRFYFPNIDRNDNFGSNKPIAYRGYRHLALDFLVSAYNLSKDLSTPNFEYSMNLLQRHFTSMIYEFLNPHDRIQRLSKLTEVLSPSQQSYEQFYENDDAQILRHLWPQ